MYTWHVSSGVAFRRLNSKYFQHTARLASFLGHCKSYKKVEGYRIQFGLWFREQSIQVAKACARQFEFIAAQRIRRSVQLFYLYSRIWDEIALRALIKSWRNRIGTNTRHFLIGVVGITTYNWDSKRISDDEMKSYNQEIEGIYRLRDSTVVCAKCHLRIMIDIVQPNVKYCTCHGVKHAATSNQDSDGWQPFIERQDMLIWRKQDPDSGLYAYKVYGSFSDVTAEDFLKVQIDVDYRKKWDLTAQELQIIETDPLFEASEDHSSDVIYWEMIWPRLFSNRDYVYQRRWVVDRDKKLIVIVSKVTDHPNVPNRPGTYRVTAYWSYMVIKPYTNFDDPGIEFGLTYFDDPGVNVPSAVTAWVAMSGLPDFLCRMRQASKDYRDYKMTRRRQSPKSTGNNNNQAESRIPDKQIFNNTEERNSSDCSGNQEDVEKIRPSAAETLDSKKSIDKKEQELDINQISDDSKDFVPEKNHGLLRYFNRSKLFA